MEVRTCETGEVITCFTLQFRGIPKSVNKPGEKLATLPVYRAFFILDIGQQMFWIRLEHHINQYRKEGVCSFFFPKMPYKACRTISHKWIGTKG